MVDMKLSIDKLKIKIYQEIANKESVYPYICHENIQKLLQQVIESRETLDATWFEEIKKIAAENYKPTNSALKMTLCHIQIILLAANPQSNQMEIAKAIRQLVKNLRSEYKDNYATQKVSVINKAFQDLANRNLSFDLDGVGATLLDDLKVSGLSYSSIHPALVFVLNNVSDDFKEKHRRQINLFIDSIPILGNSHWNIIPNQHQPRQEYVTTIEQRHYSSSGDYEWTENEVVDNNPCWNYVLTRLPELYPHLAPAQQQRALNIILHTLSIDRAEVIQGACFALNELYTYMSAEQLGVAKTRLQQCSALNLEKEKVDEMLRNVDSCKPASDSSVDLWDDRTHAWLQTSLNGVDCITYGLTRLWPINPIFYEIKKRNDPYWDPKIADEFYNDEMSYGSKVFINELAIGYITTGLSMFKDAHATQGLIGAVLGIGFLAITLGIPMVATCTAVGIGVSTIHAVLATTWGIMKAVTGLVAAGACAGIGALVKAHAKGLEMVAHVMKAITAPAKPTAKPGLTRMWESTVPVRNNKVAPALPAVSQQMKLMPS